MTQIITVRFQVLSIAVLTALLFTGCANNDQYESYRADVHLDEEDARQFVYSIIRYAGPLARGADHETKFDSEFDADYWQIAIDHRLDWFHVNPSDGFTYFGLSRIAPSVHVKRVTIGGRLTRDEIDPFTWEITQYEELFRTWRLPEDELMRKSGLLFHAMVTGRDLSPYYPENSGAEEYIEFPNQFTWFDADTRVWVSSLENPVEELRRTLRSAQPDEQNGGTPVRM